MKLTEHEKELLDKAMELVTEAFENEVGSNYGYFDEREGEEEYFEKIEDESLSDDEIDELEGEFEDKPTHFEELIELIDRLKEE